jgi:hypothetical protein
MHYAPKSSENSDTGSIPQCETPEFKNLNLEFQKGRSLACLAGFAAVLFVFPG